MGTLQILSLIGVPTICATVIIAIARKTSVTLKKHKDDNDALKLGVQALLRSQLIRDYNKYIELGYAPIFARENFINCYNQYHNLGENGVMDDLKDKFLELPTEKKK